LKALVTGGAGFIGSHLVDELIHLGAEVHVLDNLVTGSLDHLHTKAVVHIMDLCNPETKQIIRLVKPDVVFHLAAQIDVQQSIRKPEQDANVNIIGTIQIMEACCEANVKKIIFSSTAGVYGDLQKEMISELDPTVPISYYGLSKLSAEAYIRLFHRLYGVSFTILRYANVYGPRQTVKGEGGVVALFLNQLSKDQPLYIHGNGEQTRDFVYVKDIIQANLAAMNCGHQETIQVSTASRTSINQLTSFLSHLHGSELNTVHSAARPGDIKHSCLDNKKAHEILQWQPQYDIYAGLKETYHFFMKT
jgi:UDP-glucose 4-epimerase